MTKAEQTATKANASEDGIVGIDYMRGFGALFVLLYHLIGRVNKIYPISPEVLHYSILGTFGVDIFFVVSGFCIAFPFFGSNRPLNVPEYYMRRFFRIYIPHITVLLGLFLLFRAGFSFGGLNLSRTDWISNFCLLNAFTKSPHINAVTWTLCYEIMFYIYFPILFLVFKKYSKRAFNIFCIAFLATGAVCSACGIRSMLTDGYYITWILGIVLIDLYKRKNRIIGNPVALVLGITGIVAFNILATQPVVFYGPLLKGISASLIVAFAIGIGKRIMVLRFLGIISFSIYLIHNVSFVLLERIYQTLAHNSVFAALPVGLNIAFYSGYLLVGGLLFGTIFFFAVERPSLLLIKVLSRRIRAKWNYAL
jgi:peptidoglycan/LPS O-acetylase OafA/YrhL